MEAILESGATYISGPQWLAEHVLHHPSQPRHVLAVAGTHGKTTTTSMLTWILQAAGLEPGFLVGGVPMNFGVSARLGRLSSPTDVASHKRTPFVIEADEYDTAFFDKRSKFVHYHPRTAILNNLEFDHADIFDNLAAIERQFHHLVRTVPGSGRVVVNADEDSLQRVLNQGSWSDVAKFGVSANALADGWSVQGEPDNFAVLRHGQEVGRVQWDITGVHNQLNTWASHLHKRRLRSANFKTCVVVWKCAARSHARAATSRCTTTLRITPLPFAPRWMACAAKWDRTPASWRCLSHAATR
jgi:UDP-N-acetylmuramate: L-alanyl-gamma-D-glutamyl-meso-diaminopimelate ligase